MSSLTAVELTRELIRFNTVNPPGNEHACAVYVAGILDKAGLRVEFQSMSPGRSNLIAMLDGKGTKPPICLSGHLDTVPLGTAPWRHDPFEGHVADGKIHGRGASDMKSGVAAIVAAVAGLLVGVAAARVLARRWRHTLVPVVLGRARPASGASCASTRQAVEAGALQRIAIPVIQQRSQP